MIWEGIESMNDRQEGNQLAGIVTDDTVKYNSFDGRKQDDTVSASPQNQDGISQEKERPMYHLKMTGR